MRHHQIAPWLLLIVIALIYLSFPTRVYYWDGIVFAQAIEDASTLKASLVHPNHLIYNFAGYIFYKLLRSLGADVRAVTALQILNSLLSAACAGVFFVILKDTLRSLYFAVCLTLLFAFSATWWKFSTDANAYIPSVLFLLISFYLVLPDRKPRPLLLSVAFFISMAFHQLAALLFPVFALGVYLQDRSSSVKRRALNVISFSILSIVLILAGYVYLFSLARGSFDIFAFKQWVTSYSPDADTQFRFWSNLQYTLRGHVRLFFGGRFNLIKGLMNPLVVLLLGCLIGAVLWLLFSLWRSWRRSREERERRPRMEPRQQSVLVLSLIWTFVYVVFLFFWLPQNTFYRLFYLPALILLFGLGLSSLMDKTSQSQRLVILVTAVGLANFLFLIYPFSHVEKYPPLAFALELNREWPAGTVIFYGAENSDVSLVRYFTPGIQWRRAHLKFMDDRYAEMAEVYSKGGTVWFETSLLDGYTSNPYGTRWLETHARKETVKELNDGAYRIRFVQVVP